MCKVLAPQQLVPYEHSLVSLLLKYRLEKSILGHQVHCPTVTGTMSYNHLLKFASLIRQFICPYWTYWMSTSNLHFTEAQEHSHSQPIDAQYISIRSYASLAYLLFLFCVLYMRQSHPLTSFARLTKSRFSVVSCKISFFLMILYFILFKALNNLSCGFWEVASNGNSCQVLLLLLCQYPPKYLFRGKTRTVSYFKSMKKAVTPVRICEAWRHWQILNTLLVGGQWIWIKIPE